MTSNNITHYISNYRKVFILLLIATALTVWASYLEFNVQDSIAGAIFVGLTIAIIKGYLVAANFMHLNNEKKLIYGVLALTAFFFLVLLAIPIMWKKNSMDVKNNPKTVFEYKEINKHNGESDH